MKSYKSIGHSLAQGTSQILGVFSGTHVSTTALIDIL